MIGLTIPVVALSNDGEEVSDRVVRGRPCIRVGFSWQEVADPSLTHPSINWTYGMIDTGADITAIDRDFALRNPAESPAPVTARLVDTASDSALMPIYKSTLVFTNGVRFITVETEVALSPSVHSGYRVILGRHFLQYTTFTYNRTHGIEKMVIG